MAARVRAKRVSGRARPRRKRVVDPVDVAEGRLRCRSAARATSSRSRWRAPVSGRLIGTPAKTRGSGRRRPMSHQPPSSAGPSVASRSSPSSVASAPSRSAAVDLRRVHADLHARSACGLPGGGEPEVEAAGRPAGRRRPRVGTTGRDVRRARAPRGRPRTRARRRGCRRWRPRRAPPPRSGRTAGRAGSSPGPERGSLAITRTCMDRNIRTAFPRRAAADAYEVVNRVGSPCDSRNTTRRPGPGRRASVPWRGDRQHHARVRRRRRPERGRGRDPLPRARGLRGRVDVATARWRSNGRWPSRRTSWCST